MKKARNQRGEKIGTRTKEHERELKKIIKQEKNEKTKK